MSRPRVVTHAYRMPGGWEKIPRHALTSEYAHELRAAGFTMIRGRRGWFNIRERSVASYLPRDPSEPTD